MYTDQYQAAYVTKPATRLKPHERDGKIRRMFASVTLTGEITTTDSLYVGKLPANAVPTRARVVAPGGTAGTLALGWGAGASSEAADADGFLAAIDGSAAVNATMDIASSSAGLNKRFAEEVDVILSASVDSAGWTGDLVKVEIEYVIE